MNTLIENNYSKLKLSLFYLPLFLLILIVVFLFEQDALNTNSYIQIQKESFYYLNSKLSQIPQIQYNLTQFGDAFIFLSVLLIFIVYAPKIWESLITSCIISAIFSKSLKMVFSVPRPAAVLDTDSFIIIGKVLRSSTSSLPSGHSITIFTLLTVIMFGFMPRNKFNMILWIVSFIFIGLILAFTRVAIGAHFPLDVIIGCIFGYISGLSGIFINQKYNICKWINNKKYYPFFILLFIVSLVVMVSKIINENLIIFYLSSISLLYSLNLIIKNYVKK